MVDESLHALQLPRCSRGFGKPQGKLGIRTPTTLQPFLRQARPLGVKGQEVPTRAQAVEQHVVGVRVDVATSTVAAIEEVRVGDRQVVAEAHRPCCVGGHLDIADLVDDGGADVRENDGRTVTQSC